jgi:signal transduction histidine kinase
VWLWGWLAVAHLVLTMLLSATFLGVVVFTLGGVLGAASVLGLPILVVGLLLAFGLAVMERWRLYAFTGMWVAPWPSRPRHLPLWRRALFDSRPWRALLYLTVVALWGLTGGAVVFAVLVLALAVLLLPAVPVETGEPNTWLQRLAATDGAAQVILVVSALSALVALPLLARLMTHVDRGLARLLIGASDADEVRRLSDRVDTLTHSRQAVVDSVEVERRRIERDLHDGPQQRLVAVAMDLGLARQRLDTDPAAAATLLERAHTGAKEAIVEMRRVARGIHPPVLTDRGLDAALSALAARSPVPVSVRVDLPRRPAARLEAIAYFCVSEALTNVAKHARARSARVRVEERYGPEGGVLVATVTDDGVGGADPSRGSGLAGLRDRVAAVDGRVLLSSPPGGPTVITVELPFAPAGEQPRAATAPGARAPLGPASSPEPSTRSSDRPAQQTPGGLLTPER